VRANQRNKRERLCRYISRPALSEHRLSLSATGKVRYQLKTPYSNGTTHVVFEPSDFQCVPPLQTYSLSPAVPVDLAFHRKSSKLGRHVLTCLWRSVSLDSTAAVRTHARASLNPGVPR